MNTVRKSRQAKRVSLRLPYRQQPVIISWCSFFLLARTHICPLACNEENVCAVADSTLTALLQTDSSHLWHLNISHVLDGTFSIWTMVTMVKNKSQLITDLLFRSRLGLTMVQEHDGHERIIQHKILCISVVLFFFFAFVTRSAPPAAP